MRSKTTGLLVEHQIIDKRNELRKDLVDKWIDARTSGRFIYGDNEAARKISEIYPHIGVVTDTTLKQFNKQKLSESIALSVIMGVLPVTAMSRARKLSTECIDIFSFFYFLDLEKYSPIFVRGMKEETLENLRWYEEFFCELEDNESRKALRSLVNFRANWDMDFLRNFKDRRESQYLENFMKIGKEDVFFDVGAYSGDSYSAIKRFYGGVKQAILFEPNPQSRQKAVLNLKDDSRVEFSEFALGDQNCRSSITLNETRSQISDSGQVTVEVRKLDDLALPIPSFIKADIEGFEESFLEGAKKTISKYRPKLAIAVYHTPKQLRQVVEICSKLLPNSEFRLRHYTEGFTETILYVLPREKVNQR